MKTIVFASSNQDKVREVREVLEPLGYQVLSLKDLNLEVTHPEDSETFEGNSKIKAEDIAGKCDYPVLSDDSGLSIDALDGFPGVHSARFMEGHSYHEKNQALIDMLKDKDNKKASYYTVMTYIDKKKGIEKTFPGENAGEITSTIDENPINGFGYDPIFYSYDLKKTFSQATPEEKDAVSHRGRALLKVVEFLKEENENEEKEDSCFCKYCGKKMMSDSMYCPYCGKKVKSILLCTTHITQPSSFRETMLMNFYPLRYALAIVNVLLLGAFYLLLLLNWFEGPLHYLFPLYFILGFEVLYISEMVVKVFIQYRKHKRIFIVEDDRLYDDKIVIDVKTKEKSKEALNNISIEYSKFFKVVKKGDYLMTLFNHPTTKKPVVYILSKAKPEEKEAYEILCEKFEGKLKKKRK